MLLGASICKAEHAGYSVCQQPPAPQEPYNSHTHVSASTAASSHTLRYCSKILAWMADSWSPSCKHMHHAAEWQSDKGGAGAQACTAQHGVCACCKAKARALARLQSLPIAPTGWSSESCIKDHVGCLVGGCHGAERRLLAF